MGKILWIVVGIVVAVFVLIYFTSSNISLGPRGGKDVEKDAGALNLRDVVKQGGKGALTMEESVFIGSALMKIDTEGISGKQIGFIVEIDGGDNEKNSDFKEDLVKNMKGGNS